MCSVSPGWLVPGFGFREDDFQPHYKTEAEFFFALAEAMSEEYRPSWTRGCPPGGRPAGAQRLGCPASQDRRPPHREEYRKEAQLRVDALNHALRGIPEDRVRHHMCWGS